MESQMSKNTDREIWRKVKGDLYSPSIFVTERNEIGIRVGGLAIVRSIEDWHEWEKKLVVIRNRFAVKPWKRRLAYWLLGW